MEIIHDPFSLLEVGDLYAMAEKPLEAATVYELAWNMAGQMGLDTVVEEAARRYERTALAMAYAAPARENPRELIARHTGWGKGE